MFSVLEQAREELRNVIEDYTITQVTLDDVFVNFAKIQQENEIINNNNNENNWLNRKKKNILGKLNKFQLKNILINSCRINQILVYIH
jgi:hypothetical protein